MNGFLESISHFVLSDVAHEPDITNHDIIVVPHVIAVADVSYSATLSAHTDENAVQVRVHHTTISYNESFVVAFNL